MAKLYNENEYGCSLNGGWLNTSGPELKSISPVDGSVVGTIQTIDEASYEKLMAASQEEFLRWRTLPAPKRGEIVRQIAGALRDHKDELGRLVTLEMGKIYEEGLGEVQEAIDIADFAVGLSRQLYGVTTHSERPSHRMYEQWHPLGTIGIISAFNFPVAVWAWNAMIAAVCGDIMIWKPSSKTPFCAIAAQKIVAPILKDAGFPNVMNVAVGSGLTLGEWMINDRRIPLISATGSCRMGYRIGAVVGERLGKHILELGGNNGIIVCESSDIDLALRAVMFGAVGTAGQRCTTTRRLFLHKSIAEKFTDSLVKAYSQVPIGNPLEKGTLMGPLVDHGAVDEMQQALEQVKREGGEILYGGEILAEGSFAKGSYVRPCLVKAHPGMKIVRDETFAPILYIFTFSSLKEAIALHNSVEQGLSSAIFTKDLLEAELFLSCQGSDCGIANVNIGTSGAEIGLAFGGEKETGGGRES
ncbi:MAG: aldehyde dehydrogenase family protein, partial [bacterium]|nr:aldehyde dehydrogenase family protein [bacterium]